MNRSLVEILFKPFLFTLSFVSLLAKEGIDS